ncbi:MAG: hypothetical protein K8S99_12995 [Planctomycetes bacterium]|nr:hypothetical protein [Planctomycetota bacterium]
MSRQALSSRLAWQDRWSQPSLDQLLRPLNAQHTRLVNSLMEQLAQLSGVEQSIIWYGPAWKWTIAYTIKPATTSRSTKLVDPHVLCYIVPKVDGPLVCVPLNDGSLDVLPIQRLTKFVRDGIKLAKFAVAIHWAMWTPATLSEVAQIVDLIKRLHKAGHSVPVPENKG